MIFEPIKLFNGDTLQLRELDIGQSIEIAKIDKKLYEYTLSVMLSYITNKSLAYCRALTVQERYFLLVKYMEVLHNAGQINFDVDFSIYSRNLPDRFDTVLSDVDISVRQLNGFEVEYLEKYLTDRLQWNLSALALQIKTPTINQLPVSTESTTDDDLLKEQKDRIQAIKSINISEFEDLFFRVNALNEKMACYVRISYDDNGIVIAPAGGELDSFARFRAYSCIGNVIRNLT